MSARPHKDYATLRMLEVDSRYVADSVHFPHRVKELNKKKNVGKRGLGFLSFPYQRTGWKLESLAVGSRAARFASPVRSLQ